MIRSRCFDGAGAMGIALGRSEMFGGKTQEADAEQVGKKFGRRLHAGTVQIFGSNRLWARFLRTDLAGEICPFMAM